MLVGPDSESDVKVEEEEVDDEEEPGEDGEHVDVHLCSLLFVLRDNVWISPFKGHRRSLTLFTLEQTKGLQVEMEPFLSLRWRTEN